MGTRTAQAGKHTMRGALDAQRKYARQFVRDWCEEGLKSEYWVGNPNEFMDRVILPRLWALYCKEFDALIRWSTVHSETWGKHDRELIGFVEKYTAYKNLWAPVVTKHHMLFPKAMRKEINFDQVSEQLKKEFLRK